MKRFLYLLGFLVILAAMVGIGYFFRTRNASTGASGGDIFHIGTLPSPQVGGSSNPPSGASGGNPGGQAAPGTGTQPSPGTVTQLPQNMHMVLDAEVAAFFAKDEKNVVVVEPTGKIEALQNGTRRVLSENGVADMTRADFSADGAKILVASGPRSAPSWSVFDVKSMSWLTLPAGVKEAAWAPQGSRIAYTFVSGPVSELRTVDMGVSPLKPQTISPLSVEDVRLVWTRTTLFIESLGNARIGGSVMAYDTTYRAAKMVLVNQLGATSVWNASGTRGMAWQSDTRGQGGNLALIDQSGATTYGISFVTLPSKCAFSIAPRATSSAAGKAVLSTESIFCGVPRDASTFLSHALPDDYETGELVTSDDIYRIDAVTGSVETVFNDATYHFDVTKITPANGVVFFVNRSDHILYALSVGV